MNRLLLSLIIFTGIYSCGDKAEKNKEPVVAEVEKDTTAHLPVLGFLQDDIRKVDSFSTGIVRKTNGSKKDSAFVKLPEFHRYADQFLLKELDSAAFENNFKETSLMDETSGMFNFIYEPKDSATSLRQVMVYLKPSQANDNIDRIYMITNTQQGDTLVEKKMTWKMRKYFYVLTIKQPKTGNSITTMEKLIWDPQHFADN
jgi:hypothetical protein